MPDPDLHRLRHRRARLFIDRDKSEAGQLAAEYQAFVGEPAEVILVIGGPLVLDDDAEAHPKARARLRTSLARTPAVPRHYVLALPWRSVEQDDPGEGRVHIYEPSSGSVRPLDLTAPRDPHRPGPRELGNWPRVIAVIAPENNP